ncbi:MAG: flagellar export protein FliJ [Desulfocucumaceae bacterium]
MKKFLFRLEPVLKNRSGKEDKAILAQSIALKEYKRQVNYLEKISNDLKDVAETEMSSITAQECLTRSLYMDYLTLSMEKQEKAVELALRQLETERKLLIQARKDKLVLEKLKDKLYNGYTKKINMWEAKVNDDQCMALAHRRKG